MHRKMVKRAEHSYWNNEVPITDVHEALYVLAYEPTSSTPLYLARGRETVGGRYELIVHWHNHSGYGSNGVDYYQIDQALAKQLVNERLVVPRKILHLGYTETCDDQFVISPDAREKLKAFQKEMDRKAVAMLTPGVHTDLSGKPKYANYRKRDGFRCGKVCFEFELPQGGTVKVYPEEDRLVMPEKEKAKSA